MFRLSAAFCFALLASCATVPEADLVRALPSELLPAVPVAVADQSLRMVPSNLVEAFTARRPSPPAPSEGLQVVGEIVRVQSGALFEAFDRSRTLRFEGVIRLEGVDTPLSLQVKYSVDPDQPLGSTPEAYSVEAPGSTWSPVRSGELIKPKALPFAFAEVVSGGSTLRWLATRERGPGEPGPVKLFVKAEPGVSQWPWEAFLSDRQRLQLVGDAVLGEVTAGAVACAASVAPEERPATLRLLATGAALRWFAAQVRDYRVYWGPERYPPSEERFQKDYAIVRDAKR